MKITKKTLLKTLFISALSGISVFGGCKKNHHNDVPQKKGEGGRLSTEELWKIDEEIRKWESRNIQYNTKQRD